MPSEYTVEQNNYQTVQDREILKFLWTIKHRKQNSFIDRQIYDKKNTNACGYHYTSKLFINFTNKFSLVQQCAKL